ncbi:DUF4097 family beta strand repeat-containing protein [Alicyclobacillus sp. SP_1]|jgi:hypothetical protein|uniref:SHOCT-like domain-containing protein n=1 Tax=Alicyclobacillus sp. SP_1 TaxID=2942475 RepID=UPI002157FCAB|nr:DUF4097 family beta strand repeat-containing protein [Alicyclobacillus sp. SP_1]
MNGHDERMKVLELLESGKISAEEAHRLLSALESPSARRIPPIPPVGPHWNRAANEWKSVKNQLSSMVAQTVADVRRSMETQVGVWKGVEPTTPTAHEIELPQTVRNIALFVSNGNVHLQPWDKSYARVYIRAQMRTAAGDNPKEYLLECIDTTEADSTYSLRISDTSGKHWMSECHVDVYLPQTMDRVEVKSQNGPVSVYGVIANVLDIDTQNGHITVQQSSVHKLRATTLNGRIDLRKSIENQTESVYLTTKNGRIEVTGLKTVAALRGTAKTDCGTIHISETALSAEFPDGKMKNVAQFMSLGTAVDTERTEVYCETKNGNIHLED